MSAGGHAKHTLCIERGREKNLWTQFSPSVDLELLLAGANLRLPRFFVLVLCLFFSEPKRRLKTLAQIPPGPDTNSSDPNGEIHQNFTFLPPESEQRE